MSIDNPVAVAKIYKRMLESVLKNLIGLPPSDLGGQTKKDYSERGPGLFGCTLSYLGATETSQRGGLHAHMILNGGIPPRVYECLTGVR